MWRSSPLKSDWARPRPGHQYDKDTRTITEDDDPAIDFGGSVVANLISETVATVLGNQVASVWGVCRF